ncbi:TetR/AcrR family transcriptional regulator [Paenibacillus paeoniae]|uniref:TetR/AcrR family transcriptional regulator n=1 Tax=Paenibacillus paeoniae TaxID=2292705 RepID=A0A371PKV6_9BACL|nr:TetR/AcrR family transcriptional regulator [Paenibacillus paeoniae]REK76743.1 TetR/AcrR family transcriptional regulator [Paenibacillus paeoniae]
METKLKTDRRIVRTREAIVKAFLELFAEKELEHITINDIADKANVNRGTVYLHYSDKYDLLDKCIESHLNKLFSFCQNHEAQTATPLVHDLRPVFLYFEENYSFFSSLLFNQQASMFRERLVQFMSDSVRDKLKNNTVPSEINDELNAQFVASAFIGVVEWWIQNKMPYPPAYMAEQMFKLFEKNEVSIPV